MLQHSPSQNKQNQLSFKKQDFRIKNARLINSCPRQKTSQTQSYSRVSTSRPSTILSQSRNISLWEKNHDFHDKRRQSQLNSLFRIRKQKLQAITKFNKEFYVKLNTQESHYTSRQTSKQKDLNRQQPFSFKTIDSVESRQILGPIVNFNPLFGLSSTRFTSRQNNEKENYQRELETLNQSRNQRQSEVFCTPLRIKLTTNTKQNPQKDENLPLTQRSPKLKHINQPMQFQSFLQTPQRRSKLPEIYSFF